MTTPEVESSTIKQSIEPGSIIPLLIAITEKSGTPLPASFVSASVATKSYADGSVHVTLEAQFDADTKI